VTQIRLRDVARVAGVSPASVSRVLNAPERVRPALRRQVEAALAELRYLPNGPARALASHRARTIGAVVPHLDLGIFVKGLKGLEERLCQAGYALLVASADTDLGREEAAVRALAGRGVDALVLVGQRRSRAVVDLLERLALPVVTTYLFDPASPRPCLGFDHRAAMRRVVEHLLELGHRRIAVLTGPNPGNDRIAARLEGVHAALADAGLALAEEALLETAYSITDGRTGLRTLLDRGVPMTALVCTTDLLAFGVLAEARVLGIRVPEQLSVTGFDDLEPAAHLDPPLTTVHIPAEELGRRTAEWLLARLDGRHLPERVELQASLVLRGSTARPPARPPAGPPALPPTIATPGGPDAAFR
jgi:LacI family transcriptional regulator